MNIEKQTIVSSLLLVVFSGLGLIYSKFIDKDDPSMVIDFVLPIIFIISITILFTLLKRKR